MNQWRVAPSGFDGRMAHVFIEIETIRGITYYRSACGKKVFTMGENQLTARAKHKCCARCEQLAWRAFRKGRAGA